MPVMWNPVKELKDGSNQLAQIVLNGANTTKVTALKLYGNRVGSPPNPLFAEIRKVEVKDQVMTVYTPATTRPAKNLTAKAKYMYVDRTPRSFSFVAGDNTLATLSPELPAGTNVVIAIVSLDASSYGKRISIKRDTTTIALSPRSYHANETLLAIAAIDSGAPANATYSLIVNSAGAETRNITVHFVVFPYSSAAIARTTSTVSVGSRQTANVLSITPGFSSFQLPLSGSLGGRLELLEDFLDFQLPLSGSHVMSRQISSSVQIVWESDTHRWYRTRIPAAVVRHLDLRKGKKLIWEDKRDHIVVRVADTVSALSTVMYVVPDDPRHGFRTHIPMEIVAMQQIQQHDKLLWELADGYVIIRVLRSSP